MVESRTLILSVDDEAHILHLITRTLEPLGYEVITAPSGDKALSLLQEKSPEVMLLDIKMPGKSGLEILPIVRDKYPDIAVIMATGLGDVKNAIQALKAGAFDYLVKPFKIDELTISVERALEKRRLILNNRQYKESLERQLSALNNLFQTHIALRQDTEEIYVHLTSRLEKLSAELESLLKEADSWVEWMRQPPSEKIKKPSSDGSHETRARDAIS